MLCGLERRGGRAGSTAAMTVRAYGHRLVVYHAVLLHRWLRLAGAVGLAGDGLFEYGLRRGVADSSRDARGLFRQWHLLRRFLSARRRIRARRELQPVSDGLQ